MVYDFLNTACNTPYVYFIIYFITSINFIIAIYEIVISILAYNSMKYSNLHHSKEKPNEYRARKYKEKKEQKNDD